MTSFDNDFAGSFRVAWINNVVDSNLAVDLGYAATIGNFFNASRIECAKQFAIGTQRRRHRAKQCHDGELTALVDTDAQAVLLGDIDFDPASTLRNHATAWQLALGSRFQLFDEVHTRTAVQLANHNTLGTIDDELTTAKHDWNIAQVHFFFDRLLTIQAQPNLQRLAIGQAKLTAFGRRVSRLTQFVAQIFNRYSLVIAFDREDFAKHPFQADVLALIGR